MNTFRRNERFQGHMISALPNTHRCAECHAQLVYAGDDVCEKVSCVKHLTHTGFVKIEDVLLVDQEKLLAQGMELYMLIRSLPADSPLLGILRARNAKTKAALFGEDE